MFLKADMNYHFSKIYLTQRTAHHPSISLCELPLPKGDLHCLYTPLSDDPQHQNCQNYYVKNRSRVMLTMEAHVRKSDFHKCKKSNCLNWY